mmetsp:Transcript_36253/g.63572  ORF Transcript_36253/g.63572 Transcript_36253/m.63572 type:complete len:105 (-) Transcript_36253:169-483(-)
MLMIETVLGEVLPIFLPQLDAEMKSSMGDEYELPLLASPYPYLHRGWEAIQYQRDAGCEPGGMFVDSYQDSGIVRGGCSGAHGVDIRESRGIDILCRYESVMME